MTAAEIANFCRALPGAQEDLKWGSNRVFSVYESKMFAILDISGERLAFKVNPELFLGYVDRPGIRPAPYLARAHWISMSVPHLPLTELELRHLLIASHQQVVRRLPKRMQPGLLLNQ
ncbi:MmcQ/YjbR family DNA-binding protein [Pseudomonas sp. NCCP-436]|uniref:MmcQ/YjbR family DNA-binding protein n=1 Tax=Pseudomonas sp. NCCP-436 TaxID=2842481 RepID=UPI001C7FB2C5|nr:MmcQ/YjbR family DNA-binding protein [Pseudomonas sp. NCCP-436]GIZ11741.1 hypothetical protein NCCP436_11570 [Pseudomonas sp. NCCP-436]